MVTSEAAESSTDVGVGVELGRHMGLMDDSIKLGLLLSVKMSSLFAAGVPLPKRIALE